MEWKAFFYEPLLGVTECRIMRDPCESQSVTQFSPFAEHADDTAIVLLQEHAQREDSEQLRLSELMLTLGMRVRRQSVLSYGKRRSCE
jgi:hypothetical protein